MFDDRDDDGLVLIEGELWSPEEVTKAAAKRFKRGDGYSMEAFTRRYRDNYGPIAEHDSTTPSMADHKAILGKLSRKKRR